jgi:phenylalanyl-tRNA synthetase beta chain
VQRRVAAFEPVPKFQPAQRDIAVIVADTVTHDAVHGRRSIGDTSGLLQDACCSTSTSPSRPSRAGRHEKSLAVRLTLASGEATLTDEQIDGAVKAVVDSIAAGSAGA